MNAKDLSLRRTSDSAFLNSIEKPNRTPIVDTNNSFIRFSDSCSFVSIRGPILCWSILVTAVPR